jgi:hypothetical protein
MIGIGGVTHQCRLFGFTSRIDYLGWPIVNTCSVDQQYSLVRVVLFEIGQVGLEQRFAGLASGRD